MRRCRPLHPARTAAAIAWLTMVVGGVAAAGEARSNPPLTQDGDDRTPRPYVYVEPKPLQLPGGARLNTLTVRGRTYEIHRVPAGAKAGPAERAAPGRDGLGLYGNRNESLFFAGRGRGGVESRDRLVVEDCTFVIDFREGDFDKWDERRAAVYVNGFSEVLVRNCVFVSKARGRDPQRKVVGSIVAYDCQQVQVDDCYFEGRTDGFRGHVLVFGCGPTSIRNCEINGRGETAGGIWVATGVGEGKIGWPHKDGDPSLMIYPPGPLLVENCHVHNQKGKENSDGIYVQSIHPYLIRNCKVERWGPQDSLIDVGFRDTRNPYGGKRLANHGAVGVIEHCEFADGWVKDSVGAAGGLVFRNNVLRAGTWLFPYVFDGGGWYVVGNQFDGLSGVIVSGKNEQFGGWTPKEGMFANGSKMYLYGNRFANKSGERMRALYVAGAAPGPLKDAIRADYNVYDLDPLPKAWGMDVGDVLYKTVDHWREQTGNDRHSAVGDVPLGQVTDHAPSDALALPGGLTLALRALPRAGLTGPVGVSHEPTRQRARDLSRQVAEQHAGNGPAVR